AGKAAYSCDLLDPGLYPAPLIAFGDAVEDLLRLGGPLDLEAVEGLLFLDTALTAGDGDHGRLVDGLKIGAFADRAGVGFGAASGAAATTTRPRFERLEHLHTVLHPPRLA